MILKKIISGGQTGVDQAALRAAKAAGLATGGKMPLGWRTLAGPRPEFEELYGMTSSPEYAARTSANVRESDATLRIAAYFDSAGERCTLAAIRRHEKPFLDVHVLPPPREVRLIEPPYMLSTTPNSMADVVAWLKAHGVAVLNVAGNSELTAPNIGALAERYLTELFVIHCGVQQ